MLKLSFDSGKPNSLSNILLLGAHSDDIEIGCGGTILKLARENPDSCIDWVVFSAKGQRIEEAKASANAFLSTVKHKRVVIKEFRDGFFPYSGGEIKDFFEQMKLEISPDLIFTHYRDDLHQDHRLISELTWNTFRNHLILEYEIPKYDGDFGSPNLFIHLDPVTCQEKIGYLLDHFKTQENKDWFTGETFSSILRLRGIESKAPEQYAEAFYCRKITI